MAVIRPRLLVALRIAFSTACVAACLALSVVWSQSNDGSIRPHIVNQHYAVVFHFWRGTFSMRAHSYWTPLLNGELLSIPIWTMMLGAAGAAALPWVQWSKRYSLKEFLVITTLMAALIGIVVR
jgi:hypothetical protein